VLPAGSDTPALRLHKPYFYDSLQPLSAFVGPTLNQPVGWVNAKGADGLNGVKLGSVDQRSNFLTDKHTWSFVQEGLTPLTGTPKGVGSKLLHGTPLGAIPFPMSWTWLSSTGSASVVPVATASSSPA
jgi:hypothetical protein